MVDVILADGNLKPAGVSVSAGLDWAAGSSENDFELTLEPTAPTPADGWYFWLDGTDVGGRITDRRSTVTGASSVITWLGVSWHGLLAGKILRPDRGQDYLVVSGTISSILANLIKRVGLDTVFTVRAGPQDPSLSNHRFENPRYVDAYTGITGMLKSHGLRLDFKAMDDMIILSAQPITRVTNTVDSDLVDFKAQTNHRVTNHLIGLGQGELKDRLVSEWYADRNGNVSQTQSLTGVDEVVEIYDASNADADELAKNTRKRLEEYQTGGSVDITVGDGSADTLMLGDQVTASDRNTGLQVTSTVIKRVVKISEGVLSVDHELE
ncbi:hypothetical protein [Bifidobacterium moukalabense]|uniref:hypothetical protein n=1 Tax=Bifidobacterium moukalabense TaxID=1333651 RepID=UPI0010F6A420|nr:hypothetical protein [Bifidobacterium moukalabense]